MQRMRRADIDGLHRRIRQQRIVTAVGRRTAMPRGEFFRAVHLATSDGHEPAGAGMGQTLGERVGNGAGAENAPGQRGSRGHSARMDGGGLAGNRASNPARHVFRSARHDFRHDGPPSGGFKKA